MLLEVYGLILSKIKNCKEITISDPNAKRLKECSKYLDAQAVKPNSKNILPDHVQCIFVRQPAQLGLGHAILCAERAVGDEPFVVLLADDFIVPKLPNVTMNLIEAYKLNGKSQLSVLQVSPDEVTKYGILIQGMDEGSVSGIVEKPRKEDAPSNFASIGRYLLTPAIFNILRNLEPGRNNEIQLVDAIHRIAQSGCVASTALDGERFDCGSKLGFIQANIKLSIERKEMSEKLKSWLRNGILDDNK